MTIKVEVAGVDVSAIVDLTSTFTVNLPLARRGATATFSVIDSPPDGAAGFTLPFVNILDTVTIYDWDEVTPIFSGVVTHTRVRCPSPNTNIWECSCLDANYYLEAPSELVNTSYSNQTADYIVKDLFATYLPTITTANVQPGPVIPNVVLAHKTMGEALRKVALLSQQNQTIGWYIDPDYDLHWAALDQLPPAPIALSDIEAEINVGAIPFQHGTFAFEYDGTQIANRITVRGGFVLSAAFTDIFVSNGSQPSFPLTYQPSQQQGAPAPTVTVGGVSKTLSVLNQNTTPTTQWVIALSGVGTGAQTQVGTAALQKGTDPVPAAGVVIALTYRYDLPVILTMSDSTSIDQYNTPSSKTAGVHAKDVYDQTLQDYTSARARAQSELSASAYHVAKATVTLTEQYEGSGLMPGQVISFTCNQIGVVAYPMAIMEMHVQVSANGRRTIGLALEGTGGTV